MAPMVKVDHSSLLNLDLIIITPLENKRRLLIQVHCTTKLGTALGKKHQHQMNNFQWESEGVI
jgi:hypothetical protein